MATASHRSSQLQRLQIGLETTAGTKVAANKAFNSLAIVPKPNLDINGDNYRAAGSKVTSNYVIGREWSEGDVSGGPDYNEIIYPLASAIGNIVTAAYEDPPGTPVAGAFKHNFSVNNDTADDFKTFTAEYGSGSIVGIIAGMVFSALGLSFTRQEASVSGSVMGTAVDYSAGAFTASPTKLTKQPILPQEVSVYLSSDSTTLSDVANRVNAAFSAQLNVANRWGAVWPLRSDIASYDGFVEQLPEITLALMMEKNQYALTLLDALRASETQFIRLEAKPKVAGAIPYRLTVDLAAQLSANPDEGDQDNVAVQTFNFGAVEDATFGILNVEVVNSVDTL